MGGGSWSSSSFSSYTKRTKKVEVKSDGTYDSSYQDIFRATRMDKALSPYNVTRECCDSDEHPRTIPVIFELDVTGSMGSSAEHVATRLNKIMTKLYDKIKDVEFMFIAVGDFAYDRYPLQVSQFESDIRIAEQVDKIFFEKGGGTNEYESYSAGWYFGLKHCKLDCWKRGKRAIFISLGDERFNPYIPLSGNKTSVADVLGDNLQGDIDSVEIYKEAVKKFDIYHIDVLHRQYHDDDIKDSWLKVLDEQHFKECEIDEISDYVVEIITNAANNNDSISFVIDGEEPESNTEESVAMEGSMPVISW